jgi:hypothetical protein
LIIPWQKRPSIKFLFSLNSNKLSIIKVLYNSALLVILCYRI